MIPKFNFWPDLSTEFQTHKNSPLTTSDISKSSGHLNINGAKATTDSPPHLPVQPLPC